MDNDLKKNASTTLRRPVQVVKKRSGPLDNILAELSKTEESDNTKEPTKLLEYSTLSSPHPTKKMSFLQKRRPTVKDKEKKRERWLLTRKTWKYMTEAGRKLIPDGMQNCKEDIPKIEAYFNEICEAEHSFILLRRKLSCPGPIHHHSNQHIKKILQHAGVFNHPKKMQESENIAEVIELLHAYLKLDDKYKTTTLLGSKTVRPDQTASPSARRPGKSSSSIKHSPGSTHMHDSGYTDAKSMKPQEADELSEKMYLFERLCSLKKTNSILFKNLFPTELTYNVLEDKDILKKMYISLKKQQLHILLSTHSKSNANLKHSMSMSMSNLQQNTDNAFKLELGSSNSIYNNIGHNNNSNNNINNNSVLKSVQLEPKTSSYCTKQRILVSEAYKKQASIIKRHFTSSGTQTNFIPLQEIKSLAEEYKFRKQEETENGSSSVKQQDDTSTSHRKSSIDNEDVSQSVSDTIKRYLRMARKKSVHDDNANRFKRVNYDRNLRNIRAKGEINPPGMDEGTNKAVQTLDAWALLQLEFIRGIENTNLLETAHSEWEKQLNERTQNLIMYQNSIQEKVNGSTISYFPFQRHHKQSSNGSSPSSLSTSPTSATSYSQSYFTQCNANTDGYLITNSQAKSLGSELDGKKIDDKIFLTNIATNIPRTEDTLSGKESSNMQKSKSSSHVGLYVTRKLSKQRSKSQTRSDFPQIICSKWTPAEDFCWISETGKKITLHETNLQSLSIIESRILQRVALDKINELNFGFSLKIENFHKSQNRLPFLRKKVVTETFNDIKGKYETAGHCTFGITLDKCLLNDQKCLASRSSSTSEPGSTISISGSFPASKGLYENQKNEVSKLHVRSVESIPANFVTSHSTFFDSFQSPSLLTPKKKLNVRKSYQEIDSQDENEKNLENNDSRYATLNVPIFISTCLEYLEVYGLDKVGLFRVSTSKKRVKQLREEIDKDGRYFFNFDTCPHDVATLLKEFLRDLPEPLLTNKLYKSFIETQRIRNRRLQLETISHLIKLLPISHRDTLYVLLKFLSKVAISADDVINEAGELEISGNKMDSYNLATIFAPNILRSSSKTSRTQSNEQVSMQNAINVTRIMIDHYAELFSVSAELVHTVYSYLLDENPDSLYLLCEERRRCSSDVPVERRKSAGVENIKTDQPKLYTREALLHHNDASTTSNVESYF